MSQYYPNHKFMGTGPRPQKKIWLKLLKVFCWSIGVIIVLAGIGIWIIASYVNPKRIISLIEKESSEYLMADIHIGNLDYKFWRTYPWLEMQIDSIFVISKSLDNISPEIRAKLPANSDSLAAIKLLRCKLNIHDLFHNKIWMKNIEVEEPKVNIVMVNDTVGNYNIVRTMPKVSKIPELDISEINVAAPVDFSFFSLDEDIRAKLEMESFYLTKNNDNYYKIGFSGNVEGKYGEIAVPSQIPVAFTTGVKFNHNSITLVLDDLDISFAGIKVEANGEVIASKRLLDFQNVQCKVSVDNLFNILAILPSQISDKIKLPDNLSGVLPLEINSTILSSYSIHPDSLPEFSLRSLPHLSTVVRIEDANLSLTPPGVKKLMADDIFLEATCNFNPYDEEASNLIVSELRLHGEGISLSGIAEIDNITGAEPSFNGNISFGSTLMETLSYLLPGSGIKIAGYLNGNFSFKGTAITEKESLKEIYLTGKCDSHNLKVNSNEIGNFLLQNMKGNFEAFVPSYPISNYKGLKLGLGFNTDSISAKTNGSELKIAALDLNLDAKDTVSGTPDPYGILTINTNSINLHQNATTIDLQQLGIKAKGNLKTGSQSNYTAVAINNSPEDSIIEARISHTPLVVEYNGGGILPTIMNLVDIQSEVSIGKGRVITPLYILPIDLSGIELYTNLNKVRFLASNVILGKTSFSLLSNVDGLNPFLTSYSPTPLNASADINFTNVDINQLAWGYYGALIKQGKDSVYYVPPMLPFSASDSVCIAIPRNITADLRLRAQSAQYLKYTFSPLSTNIIVKDGDATLSQLTIGAPYCKAIVDWTYSTSHLDDIFMNLNARVQDFNFQKFYSVFPSLLNKAEELKNLTGDLNANIDCRFEMFPNMFMDAQSLKSLFDLSCSDLKFAREGKVEKITHLMMIEGDRPILIDNINITGAFHDNLLQINPFKISFDDYCLQVAGANNTKGDLYYHLALLKSPIHLPFGVSVFGNLKHPEFRLGGTHIDDYRAEKVSTLLGTDINANIMAYLRHGWLLFIQEAAKYEGTLKENNL